MELFPIVESRCKLTKGLWYVLSPVTSGEVTGRVGSKMVVNDTDSSVYIVGGASPTQAFGEIYRISLDTLCMKKLNSVISERYEHGSCIKDNRLFVFGGADMVGNKNDLQVVNLEIDEPVAFEDDVQSAPLPRTIHNTGIWNDEMFVWCGGGNGAEPITDDSLYSLNLDSRCWRKRRCEGEVPSKRHGHVLAAVQSQLIIHGGMAQANIFDDLYVGEITDDDTVNWREIKNRQVKPCARAAHSSAVINNKNQLFIFGGFTGATPLNDLWILDVGSLSWCEVAVEEPRPHPRLDQCICITHLPYSDVTSSDLSGKGEASESSKIQDITPLLHESSVKPEGSAREEVDPESLPPISGYQRVLILFGGMDIEGNIFNDTYAFVLDI